MAIHSIDVKTASEWLEKGEAILIDVREPSEYATVCIECATLLPLSKIQQASLAAYVGKKTIIHCRSGRRSNDACQIFTKKHPEMEIYNLEGGILAWQQQGLDVKQGEKSVLPLDQQVQLIIGSCVVLGCLLAFAISPLFILLPAVFGMGLMLAGVSGFCPLKTLIARMPWNQNQT